LNTTRADATTANSACTPKEASKTMLESAITNPRACGRTPAVAAAAPFHEAAAAFNSS
jgi:hypothetical protein